MAGTIALVCITVRDECVPIWNTPEPLSSNPPLGEWQGFGHKTLTSKHTVHLLHYGGEKKKKAKHKNVGKNAPSPKAYAYAHAH